MDHVILVDTEDLETGTMEKMEAHKLGALHRAVSVLIFNTKGELLLQRRAHNKYHSGGLWTNTCCSHPRPGESAVEAAHRRLFEEMGIKAALTFQFKFTYRASLAGGLEEHEVDHVFLGLSDALPRANSNEVSEWRYGLPENIWEDIQSNPESYTTWFRIIMEERPDLLR